MPKLKYVLRRDALYQDPDKVFQKYGKTCKHQIFKDLNRDIPNFRKDIYQQEPGKHNESKIIWPKQDLSQTHLTDKQARFLYSIVDEKVITSKFPYTDEQELESYKLLATYAYQIHLINQKHFTYDQKFDYKKDFSDFIKSISAENIKMMCLLNQSFFGYAAITSFKGLGSFFTLTTPYMSNPDKMAIIKTKKETKRCEFKIDKTGIHCKTTIKADFKNVPSTSVIKPTETTTTYTVDINCDATQLKTKALNQVMDVKPSKASDIKEKKVRFADEVNVIEKPTTQPYVKATFTQDVEIQDYALYLFFSKPPKKEAYDTLTFVPDNTKLMPLLKDFLSKLRSFDNSLTEQQTNTYKTFWSEKFLYCTTLKRPAEPTLGNIADMRIPENIKITTLAYIINKFAREDNLEGISTIVEINQNDLISIIHKLIITNNEQVIPSIINGLYENNEHGSIYSIINDLAQNNKSLILKNIESNLPTIDFSKFTQTYYEIKEQAEIANLQNKVASIVATAVFIITYFIITKLASYILLTKIALSCFAAGSILYVFLSLLKLYKFSKNEINTSLPENTTNVLLELKASTIKDHQEKFCANAAISLFATVLLFSMASMHSIVILSYLGTTTYLLSINAIFSLFIAKTTHKKSGHKFSQIGAYTSIACSAIFAPLIANPIILTWTFAFNIALIAITNTDSNTPTTKTAALRIINILSILLFYLSISAQPSILIFAAPTLSIFTIFLQVYSQTITNKTSCCKNKSCSKNQEIRTLELNKILNEQNIKKLNEYKKGINITNIKKSINSTTITYTNPNKLTEHQIVSGIKHLLKINDLNLKQKKSKVNTNNIKIISIGFVAIYLAHIYLPSLLSIQLLLASITLCLLFLQDNFYTNSKKTIKKFYPAIIGITTGLLLFNAAPINVIFAAISLLSLSIAIKFNQFDTSIACFILWYLLIKFATTNPIIVSGFILITSFIFCIIQSRQIKMQQAQNISIILILIAQVAGLFFPTLGFPMACWHHAILMQSVLEINKIIKQAIKNKLKTQPLSNNPTLFELPLKQLAKNISYFDEFECKKGERLTCNAQVINEGVLVDLETLTGQKGGPVYARNNTILPRGTKILSNCTLNYRNDYEDIEINSVNPFNFITNNIITILFVFALLASIYAWIVGSSIISAFCTVLILVCPCVFSTINSSIEYAAIYMLNNSVAINEKNTILDSLLSIYNSSLSKDISFDKTGTLSNSRSNEEKGHPELKDKSRPLIDKLIHKNFSIQIITGADNKDELNNFKTALEKNKNNTSKQKKIKLISARDKKSIQNKSFIHIGDGANDIHAWNENGIGICLPHTPDAIAQNFHFQMKNENWQNDLLTLFNVSKWANYSLFTSYIAVILYSIICTMLAAIGIITPMISCLLLCSLSIITPSFIILSAKLYNPVETIQNAKPAANIKINIKMTSHSHVHPDTTDPYLFLNSSIDSDDSDLDSHSDCVLL